MNWAFPFRTSLPRRLPKVPWLVCSKAQSLLQGRESGGRGGPKLVMDLVKGTVPIYCTHKGQFMPTVVMNHLRIDSPQQANLPSCLEDAVVPAVLKGISGDLRAQRHQATKRE